MSIITWNCQRAFDKKFPSIFKSLVFNYKPDIFVIVEPRISGPKADKVIKKLGFQFSHRIEATGFSGGIWILWSSNVSITFLANQVQFIHMEVSWVHHGSTFLFTAVYGSPHKKFRQFLWQDLQLIANNLSSPWLLAGDFNAILSPDERRGGATHRACGCVSFNNFIHNNGLVDLGSKGPKFTWRRGTLLMRLDRAICNTEWAHAFPQVEVSHLPKLLSDHRPILINTGLHQSGPSSRPFRFLAPWLSHPDFPKLVERIWNSNTNILTCLNKFTEEAQKWNHEIFGAIGKRKRSLLNRINGIQTRLEDPAYVPSEFLSNLDTTLKEEFEDVCFQEELLWIQKSSSDWLCLGDRNTHYYQTKALIRKKRNRITQLKNSDGVWLTDEQSLANLAEKSFKDLFSLDDPTFSPLSIRELGSSFLFFTL
ncbi:hypothetical protein K1719_003195 [Acacia pycnantha]|nr:hypothetical protein K1719_003195 [Acacia pycnantha]